MTKPTGTPWFVVVANDGNTYISDSNAFVEPAIAEIAPHAEETDEDAANAQLIVTAVNNHAKLVAALEAMVEAVPCWEEGAHIDPQYGEHLRQWAESVLAEVKS